MTNCDQCGTYISDSLGFMLHRATHFGGEGQDLRKSEPNLANHSYADAQSHAEIREEVLGRVQTRVDRMRKSGGFDMRKSAEDYDDTTPRARHYLKELLSRKTLVKGSEVHEVATRAWDRITSIRQIERLNSQSPATNLTLELRKAEKALLCDLLELQSVIKGSNLRKALKKMGG